jgi:putative ABC transport system permease protein
MLKNYFKIAWRNLLRNKTATAINVIGLTVGLAVCMLIVIYLVHEHSYDLHFKNHEQIYQVGTVIKRSGDENKMPTTPHLLGSMLQEEFPEISSNTKLLGLFTEDKTLLRYKPANSAPLTFYEPKGYITDSAFFKVFSYEFVEGTAATALEQPRSVVLSDEIAGKFFGKEPALNKRITVASNLTGGDVEFIVTGVFKTTGKPSHIDARFFLAYKGSAIEEYVLSQGKNLVNNNMFFTYLQLKPGTDATLLEKKFPAFLEKHAGNDLKAAGLHKVQFLTKLKDLHLHSGMDNTVTPSGNLTYLYILGSVALFVLLIACINFMNLATARSSKRSAEVGVRKVLGAEKSSLIRQFLGESVLMALISFLISLLILKLTIPVFSVIAGKELTFSFVENGMLILIFFLLAVVTGVLAGSYPAFYLSSFKPVKVLKGRIANTLAAATLRKALVVVQFIVSVSLILATVVINRQMNFLRSKDLGFAKEHQLVIPLRSETAKRAYSFLKTEISKNSDVLSVGASVYYPGIFNPEDNNLYKEGQDASQAKHTRINRVDYDFLKTLNIQTIAGRSFSSQFAADTNRSIILNEKAVKEMGFASAESTIGQKVFFNFRNQVLDFTVTGVVKDFHYEDLQQPITPYAFLLNTGSGYNYLIVHGNGHAMSKVISSVEKSWKTAVTDEPFEYSFLDADFQKNYKAQEQLSSLVWYFTCIAIIISCLGLFALAAFSAEQRIKEIGVRKVLGAGTASIVSLLSKDFLKPVLIASVIASPLAWYVMNGWLQKFAYRVNIGWQVFAVTLFAAMAIAVITVSFQAVKAALANPVKSLRSE